MKTISEKLEYINLEIKNTNVNLIGNFNTHLRNAKEIKKKYYNNNKLKLKNIDSKVLLKHNFQAETLRLAELLEKKQTINKIIKKHKIKIERHMYAPELNKTYLINKEKETKEIQTPYVVEIDKQISTFKKEQNHNYINLETFLTKKSISYLKNLLLF
jgi:hypothetical protein